MKKVNGHIDNVFLMTNQVFYDGFKSPENYINDDYGSSQKLFSTTNQVIMIAFIHPKKVLTMAL